MSYQSIIYEVKEGVGLITLNRPDRLNAWNHEIEKELREVMSEASIDGNVKAVVITGAGRGFCAGADMSDLSDSTGEDSDSMRESQRARLQYAPTEGQLELPSDYSMRYTYFTGTPKPVIAAINGPCAGLGLVMSLFCDVRFASDKAVFTTAFARRGLIAEHGIDWILPRVVGLPNALDLLLSARKFDATEAKDMGLVSKVFPMISFIDEVHAYASEMANLVSPRSVRIMKRQIYQAMLNSLEHSVLLANSEMPASFESEDFKEGVAHFVERRAPKFTGS